MAAHATSDLFTLPRELEAPNAGVVGSHYEKCELATGLAYNQDTFGGKTLQFRWTAGAGNQWYVPSRSYIRCRFQLGVKQDKSTNLGDEETVSTGSDGKAPIVYADELNARWLALNEEHEGGFIHRFLNNPLAMLAYARLAAAEKALFAGTSLTESEQRGLFSIVQRQTDVPGESRFATSNAGEEVATGNRFTGQYFFADVHHGAGFGPGEEMGGETTKDHPGTVAQNGCNMLGRQPGNELHEDGAKWVPKNKMTVEVVANLLKEFNRVVELMLIGRFPDTFHDLSSGIIYSLQRTTLESFKRREYETDEAKRDGEKGEDTKEILTEDNKPVYDIGYYPCVLGIALPSDLDGQTLQAFNVSTRRGTGVNPTLQQLNLGDARSLSMYLKTKTLLAIAPAHVCMSHWFATASLNYGGTVVSHINQHLALIDAFDKRTKQGKPFFEAKGVGNISNAHSPFFSDRAQLVGPGGWIEFCYQPPLAFFKYPHAVPSGAFQLNLSPTANWVSNGFQIVGAQAALRNMLEQRMEGDIVVTNMQMVMYNYYIQGPDTLALKDFVLDLDVINVQVQNLQSKSQATSTCQFDIDQDTYAIAVAHTDNRDGPYCEGRSLFKFPLRNKSNSSDMVLFPWSDGISKSWQSFQILFDGRQWPQQLADPMNVLDYGSLNAREQSPPGQHKYDWLDNRPSNYYQYYQDHCAHTGLIYEPSGPEDYDTWEKSGLLLYTTWPRANSNATRLQLQERFIESQSWCGSSAVDVVMFYCYRKGYAISGVEGRVIKVESLQNASDGAVML